MSEEQHNPYVAPSAAVVEQTAIDDDRLAGRGERLAASIVDTILMLAIVMPAMYFGGYFSEVMQAAQRGERISFLFQLAWGVGGFLVFVLVQGFPLATSAQTWGKRLLGIRIETMDARQPPLATLLLRRYLPMQLVARIPLLGGLIAMVDSLMIFRADHRCGHDLIAGTRVVKAKAA